MQLRKWVCPEHRDIFYNSLPRGKAQGFFLLSVAMSIVLSTAALATPFDTTFTFQSDFSGGDFHNIELVPDTILPDAALILVEFDTIRVLQVFPLGHCMDCIDITVDSLVPYGDPLLTFRIEILTIDFWNLISSLTSNFTVADPRTLAFHTRTLMDYDIIYFGIANGYGGSFSDLDDSGRDRVREFAALGRGIVLTHDTIAKRRGLGVDPPFEHPYFNSITDVTGLEAEWVSYYAAVSDSHYFKVYIEPSAPDEPILHAPFELPDSFDITACHHFGEVYHDGQIWYEGPNGQLYMHTYHSPEYGSYAAYFSTGHEEEYFSDDFRPAPWEGKAMINAMYYAYFGGRGSGVFTSEAFSAPCGGKITRLSYEADTLGGSRIYIELAASTDSINWTDWFEVVPDGSIPAPVESGPYYKYRVGMARGTRNDRPVLHSITWHFELFAPELVLALPPPNSFYSCSCGAVIWDVRCESKIELPSASVLTNSITYGPSRCTWNSVDSTFQFLGPEACWTHGETYSGVILELTAESGCRRLGDTTFTFTADFRPPIITNISPLPDTLMANSSPILCATIYDSTSDEYDSTMFWVINGDTSRFGEPGISWNNATGELTMDLASAGLSVVDTVLVCVGAGDIAVGCGTNMTDSCWSFIVDTTSPQCFPICPLDGWIVGCDSFHILFYLDDQYGIAYSTVEFSINGAAYDTSSPEVTLRGDTIDFYTSEPWSNNDTVNVQVTAGEDNAGNVLATPCHFSFVIDLSPPIITPLTPLDGATIETKQPLISALITDTYGIASDSLVLCAAGDCWGYDSLPAGLSWSEDTLSFDPVAAGYYFLEETVNIIVSACDSTQWCGPNCTDTTWTFTIADDDTIYPVWIDYTPAMWLEDSIFTVVCRAYDESGIYTTMPPDTQAPYLIWDNDGELSLSCDTVWLDFVSESAGTVTLSSSAPLISADADSDIVFVATCWDNDFDLSLASDRLRTDSPLWPVEILTRAKVEMTMPHPEWITSCTDQGIRFSIEGEVSINFESCIFVIDNDTVTFSDPELSMEGDSVIVYTPPGNIFDNGPIICKLIEAKDAFGHSLSVPLEWTFYVDADPPRFELIRPEDGAMVPEDDYGFTVTIVDSGSGLDTACIEFTVVVDGDSFTYTMDSICVNWNGLADELSFFPENSHLSTRDGDSLAILLCACDVPDLCPPNIGCIDFAYWIEPDVKCSTNTDPFTPNRDGYNDEVVFFWPRFYSSGAEISIYDMRGIPVRRYSVPPGDFKTAAWDGQDDNNRKCPAGVYIYIIEVDGKRICKGTITLAR